MATSLPNGDVDKANLAGLQRGCSRPTGRCHAWSATETRPSAGLINCQWMLPAIAACICCCCCCCCWCGRMMRVDVQRHTWRIRDIWAMFSRLMCDILFVFRQLANNVWQPPAATSWMSTEGGIWRRPRDSLLCIRHSELIMMSPQLRTVSQTDRRQTTLSNDLRKFIVNTINDGSLVTVSSLSGHDEIRQATTERRRISWGSSANPR